MLISQSIMIWLFAMFICGYTFAGMIKNVNRPTALIYGFFLILVCTFAFMPWWKNQIPLGVPTLHTYIKVMKIFVLITVLPSVMALVVKENDLLRLFFGISGVFLMIDAGFVLTRANEHFGLMNAANFDTTVMALFLPFFVLYAMPKENKKPNYFFMFCSVVCLISIFWIEGHTAKICVFVSALAWLYSARKWKAFACTLALVAFAFWRHTGFYYDSGRVDLWWKFSAPYFEPLRRGVFHVEQWIRLLFGAGAGAFEWMGFTQPVDGLRYVLIHNDYVQMFLECGLLGAGLFLALVVMTVWKSRKRPYLFAASSAYAVSMLAYFPLHFMISAALGLVIVLLANRPVPKLTALQRLRQETTEWAEKMARRQ